MQLPGYTGSGSFRATIWRTPLYRNGANTIDFKGHFGLPVMGLCYSRVIIVWACLFQDLVRTMVRDKNAGAMRAFCSRDML